MEDTVVQSTDVSICATGCAELVENLERCPIAFVLDDSTENDSTEYLTFNIEGLEDCIRDASFTHPGVIVALANIVSFYETEGLNNRIQKINLSPVESQDTCSKCSAEPTRNLQSDSGTSLVVDDDAATGVAKLNLEIFSKEGSNLSNILEGAGVDGILYPATTVRSVILPICAEASSLDLDKVVPVVQKVQKIVLGVYGLLISIIISQGIVAPGNGSGDFVLIAGALVFLLQAGFTIAVNVEQKLTQCFPPETRRNLQDESREFRITNLKIDFYFDEDISTLPTPSEIEKALRDGAKDINRALEEAGVNGIVFPDTGGSSSKKSKSNKKKKNAKKKSKSGKKGKKGPKNHLGWTFYPDNVKGCLCDDGCCEPWFDKIGKCVAISGFGHTVEEICHLDN